MDEALSQVPAEAAQAASAVAASPAGGLLQMASSLILVLLVIFALAWLARAMQRARTGRAGALSLNGGLQVGPKERVVLVQVGDQHFLVGVASGAVTLLHRFMVAPVQDTKPELSPFAEKLRQMLVRENVEPKRNAEPTRDEAVF